MTIYLVGTSHIAKESLEKVKNIIFEKNPTCVAVELDMNRYIALKSRERGDIKLPFLEKAIFSLLRSIQESLSKETNILPGQEMLDACETAMKVGAKVAFIDQDINVTMRRLMQRLGFFGKLKLISYLVIGMAGIPIKGLVMPKQMDLNKIPEEQFIEDAMAELKDAFPAIYDVLVDERNKVMAENLRKLGKECENIVAIIGAGHVKGVSQILSEDRN